MSQIFISYSRKNDDLRKQLVEYLETHNFEYWFDDEHLPVGESWADMIDREVDQSSLMVVIVTANSLMSRYVLYEWSRALGGGIPVIPLVFRDEDRDAIAVQHRAKNRHPLCLRMQYTEFEEKSFSEIVKEKLKPSVITAKLDEQIHELLLPLRILIRTYLWAYPYAYGQTEKSGKLSEETKKEIRKKLQLNPKHPVIYHEMLGLVKETFTTELPKYIIESHSALTQRQRIKLDELMIALRDFRALFIDESRVSRMSKNFQNPNIRLDAEQFRRDMLEPLIKFFRASKGVSVRYNAYDNLLDSIDQGMPYPQRYAELLWNSIFLYTRSNRLNPAVADSMEEIVRTIHKSLFPKARDLDHRGF